jgi:hypothetical protein
MVSTLHAMEWEAELVGTWAAAKALPVDSRGLVLLIPFMISTTPSEKFGCSFGNHFSSVNLWLRDSAPPLNPPHSAGPEPHLTYMIFVVDLAKVGDSFSYIYNRFGSKLVCKEISWILMVFVIL